MFRQPASKFFQYQLVHIVWGGYSNNFGWVPQIFWENQLVPMGTKWLFGWVPKISWSNQLVHWVLTGMGGWVNCKNAKIPVSTHDVGHQLDDPPCLWTCFFLVCGKSMWQKCKNQFFVICFCYKDCHDLKFSEQMHFYIIWPKMLKRN